MNKRYLISEESPLTRLPGSLVPRERIAFDGVRFSAELAGLARNRLWSSLEEFSRFRREKQDLLPSLVPPLADAWMIVEATNRVRPLLKSVGGLRKAPYVKEYLECTEDIRHVRNRVQHLHGQLDGLASRKEQAWGTLTWTSIESQDPIVARLHTIVAGTLAHGQSIPLDNVAGKTITGSLDRVMLHSFDRKINLGETMTVFHTLILQLEKQLSAQFSSLTGSIADAYFSVDLK